jgi:hypothetical protein
LGFSQEQNDAWETNCNEHAQEINSAAEMATYAPRVRGDEREKLLKALNTWRYAAGKTGNTNSLKKPAKRLLEAEEEEEAAPPIGGPSGGTRRTTIRDFVRCCRAP